MKVDETADENDVHEDDDGTIAAIHRPLRRFFVNLLNEASVGPLQAFLVQDNASVLMKSASLSERAAYRKFSLFHHHDHLITKEISRWESYPFEVDTPIAVAKPQKAKNGCVPQRRAKRSGLESAGEIKAEILKKSEAIPKLPRRRSSAVTDDAQKSNMQEELLDLFEEVGSIDEEDGKSAAGATSTSNTAPKRDRWSTPKKPIRRLSEVPPNDPSSIDHHQSPNPSNTTINRSIQDFLMAGGSQLAGGSQHSTTSTETTLSEIAARNSDLSSLLLEYPSLDCSVIMEEEDGGRENNGVAEIIPKILNRGKELSPVRRRLQSVPKKPVRRVSEVPENLADTIVDGDSQCSVSSDSAFQSGSVELMVPSNPPPAYDGHGPISAPSNDDPTSSSLSMRVGEVDGSPHNVAVDSTSTQASSSISVPKMPRRRPTCEALQSVRDIHENCKQPPLQHVSNATKAHGEASGDAQYSFSTESTALETTAVASVFFPMSDDSLPHLAPVETPTLDDSSAILEEEDYDAE